MIRPPPGRRQVLRNGFPRRPGYGWPFAGTAGFTSIMRYPDRLPLRSATDVFRRTGTRGERISAICDNPSHRFFYSNRLARRSAETFLLGFRTLSGRRMAATAFSPVFARSSAAVHSGTAWMQYVPAACPRSR